MHIAKYRNEQKSARFHIVTYIIKANAQLLDFQSKSNLERVMKLNNYRVNSIYCYKPYKNDVSYSSSNDPVNDPINDPINLTERQKMILRMFLEEKNLSRERLCEKTGLSNATAKREIAFLKKAGYLERVGSLKTGHWIVVSK